MQLSVISILACIVINFFCEVKKSTLVRIISRSKIRTSYYISLFAECIEFPSVPPLPDDAPPPPPPPPDCPPPPESPPTNTMKEKDDKNGKTQNNTEMDDDMDVIEVTKVTDIPVPDGEWIVIDEDNVSTFRCVLLSFS